MEENFKTQEEMKEVTAGEVSCHSNLHKVTRLSKYLALALFIAMPFIGGWIGYMYAPEKVVEVEKIVEVVKKTTNDDTDGLSRSDSKSFNIEYNNVTKEFTYTNVIDGYNFTSQKALTISSPIVRADFFRGKTAYGDSAILVGDSTVISKVPYTNISKESPVFDWKSCCSGVIYWFDITDNLWKSNSSEFLPEEGRAIFETPDTLLSNGVCNLRKNFGDNEYAKIESGDEMVIPTIYYYLPTDKGSAISISSTRQSLDEIETDILTSLKLIDSEAITVQCR